LWKIGQNDKIRDSRWRPIGGIEDPDRV
jgi:hypothetical protein